ncbi:MAG: hypothetical protein LC118_08120 [Dehalococcoidia bacterium]|nr:hypothetical protein [Dehalococcoidia bacterium]
MGGRPSYSPEHVRVLIEEYQALREKVDTDLYGLNYLVQMADLDRVLERIPWNYWEVVLLHGLLGLPLRTTAELLGRKKSAIAERYANALEEITHQINGGIA